MIVDAAAEVLTIPNKHLQAGATLVAYSGGKCLRGPQAAGLLLGRKDLVRAAWLHSAPHHAFGRSLKVGKEEIMGMLAAVETWAKRDYPAEMKIWESWLADISKTVTSVPGVTTEVRQPDRLIESISTTEYRVGCSEDRNYRPRSREASRWRPSHASFWETQRAIAVEMLPVR